ncbi:MAG TPA: type III-B CRISPR module RAMP protein Cmr6 [Thermoanaerobaculia bacterium]|jgi:CRISPR-associated protein Cmr6|nr:type III-B CRISPR module RAMP protein Cmr6 [Thermoanaerobaculia bacterium]
MDSRRQDLEIVSPAAGTHAGLWLEKGLRDLDAKGPGKQEHLDGLVEVATVPDDYRRFFQRWQKSVEALEPCTRTAVATALGRMVVGLGAESILETSITLHRTYGVPYIPGSALKGLAAAAAHKHLEDHPSWRKAGEKEKIGDSHRILFGDQESSGYVTFHDALWIPDEVDKRLPLDLDVMTVHHPDYYQEKDDKPPADWDSPTPVAFVSARGRYLVAVTGPEEWVNAAMEILIEAVEKDGIGAKTAAGYGRMSVKMKALPERFNWEQKVQQLDLSRADFLVPQIFEHVKGEERRRAAVAIIQKLDRKSLKDKKRRDKEWVKLVLQEAGE